MTQTVAYTIKRNPATFVTVSQSLTQRWPCTRSRAYRLAVDNATRGPFNGTRNYLWIHVTPPVPAPGTGG